MAKTGVDFESSSLDALFESLTPSNVTFCAGAQCVFFEKPLNKEPGAGKCKKGGKAKVYKGSSICPNPAGPQVQTVLPRAQN